MKKKEIAPVVKDAVRYHMRWKNPEMSFDTRERNHIRLMKTLAIMTTAGVNQYFAIVNGRET
jgi:hypothetical protein